MTGPPVPVADVRRAVRVALDDVTPGSLVLVACSGGADSLALAAAAAFAVPRLGCTAGAVVVDHGLQAGSAGVAAQAAATCARLALRPVEVARVDVASSGAGPEADARTARLAALEASADRHGAVAVLLGHTRDDQAEQVLLGLARGSGARSLAGMPARRGLFRRPFLSVPRTITRQVCRELGLSWWDDPANVDPAFARVRVRALLGQLEEALGPGVAAALARTADQLRDDAEALEAAGAALLAAATGPRGLDVGTLAQAPVAVRRRALLAAALGAGGTPSALSARHAAALDALLVRWRGQGEVHLPGGVRARRVCGRLVLAREVADEAPTEVPTEAHPERDER